MENKITQEHKLNKYCLEIMGNAPLHIEHQKSKLDDKLAEFISKKYPVNKIDNNETITLSRELFIFNREELEHFINEYNSRKQSDYEV